MAKPEFDIVVIGGGAGGLVVAAGGAALGAKVAVVEKHKLGGDCLWYGCVPSKTLLKSAHLAHAMRHADRWALAPAAAQPDLARVMERVAGVIKGIEPHDSPERFRGLGVDVIFGNGRFVGPDAFEVDGRRLTAKTFVIATGSRPGVPQIPGLDTTPYLTNETLFDLREPVPSLIVIGAGPIGSEMAQAFRRLGSEVTVVDIATQILPREDPDLAAVVFAALEAEGVRFRLGASIAGIAGRKGDVRVHLRACRRNADGAGGIAPAAGRRAHGQRRQPRPRCRRCRARPRSHRRQRRTAHDQPEHLRDRRRRRRLPVHAPRRAPRGRRAAPGAVPDEMGEALAGRALVHVHRPRTRARRTLRDRGESSAVSRTASTGSRSTRSIARAPRARPRGSPRSSPTRRAGCWAPPSSGRTPAS